MLKVILLGTSACHLCEQAETMLQGLMRQHENLSVETIDIAGSGEWESRFAIRIPVIFHPDSQQELCWPFDIVKIKQFINGLNHE